MTWAIRRSRRRALWLGSAVCLLSVAAAQFYLPHAQPSVQGQDGGKRDKRLSPPIVKPPLYECATAVTVQGFVPGATLDVYADGVLIAHATSDQPWGQSLSVWPALVTGQTVTATQTFSGVTSGPSAGVLVTSFFKEHPEGLPKPKVRDPAYECGGASAASELAPGGFLEFFQDGTLAGSASGCGASQWLFISPEFITGQKVTATETLCKVRGPESDPVIVQPAPGSLGVLTVTPVYEGGKYCDVWGITNGAKVGVFNGGSQIAGHACAGGGQVFRLNPMPAAGDVLTATQSLCGIESDPSDPVVVQPCSALPAPSLSPPCLGAWTITVVGAVPDARIRVYAGGVLIGDGGGPTLYLLRALVAGDSITVTQSLGTCTSPASKPFVVGRVTCSVPAYEPKFWNDGGTIQHNNNCYNYSNNKQTNTFAQPGRAAGITLGGDDMRCDRVHPAAVADGLLPVNRDDKCPCEKAKLALVVDPGTDYHWYRRDIDGMWSHKPGGTKATNVDNSSSAISDPETADRGGYTEFCGYFCSCSDRKQGAGHENIE